MKINEERNLRSTGIPKSEKKRGEEEKEKKKVFENVDSSMQSTRSERASHESNETLVVPTSPICKTKNIERQNLCCNPTLLPLPFTPTRKKILSHFFRKESHPVRSKNA